MINLKITVIVASSEILAEGSIFLQAGLEDYGKHEGFIQRQISTWSRST
jgi:hypothetical protein